MKNMCVSGEQVGAQKERNESEKEKLKKKENMNTEGHRWGRHRRAEIR